MEQLCLFFDLEPVAADIGGWPRDHADHEDLSVFDDLDAPICLDEARDIWDDPHALRNYIEDLKRDLTSLYAAPSNDRTAWQQHDLKEAIRQIGARLRVLAPNG